MRIGLWVTLFGSIGVLLGGDLQMKALIEGQPMKFAAMEGPMKTLMILLLGH